MNSVQVCESDFGMIAPTKRAPKRVRRMNKRKVKNWLARQLQAAWGAAKI